MFLNSLGLAFAMNDDHQTAYVHMKQALQILLTDLGQDHIEVCDIYSNLGDVCMKLVAECDQVKDKKSSGTNKQSKLEEAKKYYTQAQRIAQATFGADHTKTRQFASLLFIIDNYHSLWCIDNLSLQIWSSCFWINSIFSQATATVAGHYQVNRSKHRSVSNLTLRIYLF